MFSSTASQVKNKFQPTQNNTKSYKFVMIGEFTARRLLNMGKKKEANSPQNYQVIIVAISMVLNCGHKHNIKVF